MDCSKEKIQWLIDELPSLEKKFYLIIEESRVEFDPFPAYCITSKGDYLLVPKDDEIKKQFDIKWEIWTKSFLEVCSGYKISIKFQSYSNDLGKEWRMHDNDKNKFVEKFRELFKDVKRTLSSLYESASFNKETAANVDNMYVTIVAQNVSINISELKELYIELKNVVEKIEMPKQEKETVIAELDNAIKNPSNPSFLKTVGNKVRSTIVKYSPEMGVVISLLNFISNIFK